MIVAGGRNEIDGRTISFMRFSIDCSIVRSGSPPMGVFIVPPSKFESSTESTA